MCSFFGVANRIYNLRYWLTSLFLFFFSFHAFAGSATLTWDPSSSSGITSYKLYYGQSSGNYSSNVNVGLSTSYTVSGLQDGQTYYFAVTATDGANESGFSNEVSKTIPASTLLQAGFNATPTFGIAPLSVNFSDKSTGEVSGWLWDFGDGASSTSRNPSHSYTAAGSYTVKLTVTGPGGTDSETKLSYISVVDEDALTRVTDGQVALYTFREGEGNTVRDVAGVSGTPLDLVISNSGSVSWLSGGGLAVNAPTAIRSVGAASKLLTALQASRALTLEVWVTPASTEQSGPARIVAMSQDGISGGNFVLGQEKTQFLTRLRTSTTDKYGKPALTTSTGTAVTGLSHLVYTRDASGQAHFYINGIQESSASVGGDFSTWGDFALALANEPAVDNQGNGRPWLGELYLVALYDRALSATEVDSNFWAGPNLDPTKTWEPPTADFSANPTSGMVPLKVSFANLSTGDAESYSWDFGDGNTSTAKDPSHTYDIAGSYTVSLTVTGPGGSDRKVVDNFITVSPQPTPQPEANFSATPVSGTAPLMVNFTDTSTGDITSWSWDFGDGSNGVGQIAMKSYAKPGVYTVSLTVSGPGGSDTVTKTDLITVKAAPPVAGFSANERSGSPPLEVSFSDKSTGEVSGWLWDFGDGASSTSRNPSHSYTAAGSYTVKLTVTGPGGTDSETKLSYISVVDEDALTRVTDGQVALYTFREGEGNTVRDVAGVSGTPLDLVISNSGSVSWLSGGGLAVNAPTAIRSVGAASKLLTALQASRALTLEVWVTPASTEQSGPARIVAMSQDGISGGNFVLGQEKTQFLTRLRTSTTDKYGKPALTTSTGTAVTGLSHLVYTRDASGQAHFYINGIQESSASVGGDFSTWGDFALALANEPAVDNQGNGRPWLGELYLVALYDRALSATEVDSNFWAGPDADVSPNLPSALLEKGEVLINHTWRRVYFTKSFTDPVVVANAPSLNDGQPAVIRIRNVDTSGFDIRLQEWDYLDGSHAVETVGFLAMERGSHVLPDGTQVEAGSIELGNVHTSFKTVSILQPFSTAPVVIATVASANESDAVTTRLRNVNTSTFQVQLQEQEANTQSHAMETVNYILWEPSMGTVDGINFEVGRTADAVSHRPYYIDFQTPFQAAPIFLADMQTRDGSDTANVRSDFEDNNGVEVFVHEEQSKNSEVGHTNEVVGYMVFSSMP